ncbi:hypothetical protein DYH09_18340 [bacterium CPR1]|nr:hypothetical protein [bacterium CPR1]
MLIGANHFSYNQPGLPTRVSRAAGDRYDSGQSGYDSALAEAQAYIAAQKAERARNLAAVEELKTLPAEAMLTRGRELVGQIPAHEPELRLQAANLLFGALQDRPVASLALAILGDESQLPQTEGPSLVRQSRDQTQPRYCAGRPVDLALQALDKDLTPSQMVQLGQEMAGSVDSDRWHPEQPGFAHIRALANLVARFDPEQKLECTRTAIDFLTRSFGNYNFFEEHEGGNQLTSMIAGGAMRKLQEVLALQELHRPQGSSIGELGRGIAVGGVVLKRRGG